MIAVIEERESVVWGYGKNDAEAMRDARRWISQKSQYKVGRLRFIPLKDNAPLSSDGLELYKHCVLEPEKQAVQLQLNIL